MSGDPFLTPVMTIFINVNILEPWIRFYKYGHNWGWGESNLSKMFTFMKMVITGVENWSPDMILVAFERKFDENLNKIPPDIYRPHMLDFFQYWGWED